MENKERTRNFHHDLRELNHKSRWNAKQECDILVSELQKSEHKKLTIKNTASYEMDFKEEEILERFVRGDKSRNTDGNGLGLSIAKEFTAACGGTFNIKIDGDQFNVIISFPIETDTIPEAESVSPENI